ncbi:MAG TPA: flagellar export chaperone FliS [Firmicutes bacterium]|jgi:flagellar protein FliS|nr:flagellar export chaperone FliS [Bacillota bacterium]
MRSNPYTQYKKVQVETSDQGELLLMLYDGALRFLGKGMKALDEGDLEGCNANLLRAQDIVFELRASLDYSAGKVAASLSGLYDYIYRLLIQANIKKDIEPLYQVEKILLELRDAWKQSLEMISNAR